MDDLHAVFHSYRENSYNQGVEKQLVIQLSCK